jgi:hypothetical protein
MLGSKLLACSSKLMESNFPCSSPLCHPVFNFSFFGPKCGDMSFLSGHTVPQEFIFCLSKSSQSLGGEKKLSINSLCPKPSTLRIKCLTAACVAVMSSEAERESVRKYTVMCYIYPYSSHSV